MNLIQKMVNSIDLMGLIFLIDVIFVHEFFPGAETVEKLLYDSQAPSESYLWSILCQIISGLHAIHSAKLAYRLVDASKILIIAKRRFQIILVSLLTLLPEFG